MLCMSGGGAELLKELRVNITDGKGGWVNKLHGRTVPQISLNRYFLGGGVCNRIRFQRRRGGRSYRIGIVTI